MTYAEIAKIIGVSKQRVMQIEAEALKKLRHRLRKLRREMQAN
jgi:DNA-directed RNA polymerase sigma subunit (sigma70/sigma32)